MAGLLAAVVLLGLNLRTVVASLPPLLDTVRADLGLSGTAAGVLTALPVLCFGVLAPVVPRLVRRFAIERVLTACAAPDRARRSRCAARAAARRCSPGRCWRAAAWRSRRPRCRCTSAPATRGGPGCSPGAFSMALPLGATLAAALAVPLEDALGSWERSLAAWSLLAFAAALVWLPRGRGRA